MPLDRQDINWILDLVTAIEQDLQSLNYRITNAENVIKSGLNHVTNVLQSNSDLLDNAINEVQGIKNYTTNLSKKVLSLKESNQRNNNISYIYNVSKEEDNETTSPS